MARARRAKQEEEILGTCKDCIHAYEPRCLNYKHEYFMVKCDLLKGTSDDWSKFLYNSCKNFKQRKEPLDLKYHYESKD